jgi:hypothetical protein
VEERPFSPRESAVIKGFSPGAADYINRGSRLRQESTIGLGTLQVFKEGCVAQGTHLCLCESIPVNEAGTDKGATCSSPRIRACVASLSLPVSFGDNLRSAGKIAATSEL